MNFAQRLRNQIEPDVFTEADLSLALKGKTPAAIHSGVSRSLKAGDLIQLKRSVYAFGERLRRGRLSHFKIANQLYQPSYVSFESALFNYGLIPEAVYVTTSACPRRK